MSKFACGTCLSDYNRKHAPRYISAAETAYPVSLPSTCAQCGEIDTPMVICLGCALENNQCQNCRAEMFGVREHLLTQVRQLRARFDQSIAAHRAIYAEAIAGFKEEVDCFLAASKLAEERMNSDLQGLSEKEGADRYRRYLQELKDLPFAQRSAYQMAQEALHLALRVDRNLFGMLVEHVTAQDRLHFEFISNLSTAINARRPSYKSGLPPLPVETALASYALAQLSEEERQQVEQRHRSSFEFGRRLYERMSASVPAAISGSATAGDGEVG